MRSRHNARWTDEVGVGHWTVQRRLRDAGVA